MAAGEIWNLCGLSRAREGVEVLVRDLEKQIIFASFTATLPAPPENELVQKTRQQFPIDMYHGALDAAGVSAAKIISCSTSD